jgi:competence protein ComEA
MKFGKFGVALLSVCLLTPGLSQAAARKSASASSQTATGIVNLNTASAEQIALLPRLGAKVAQRVVDYRKANGGFKRVEDLMEVKGIGEKLFKTLKAHISISGQTTLSEKVKSTGSRSRARTQKAA